jgi:hypothetical protein
MKWDACKTDFIAQRGASLKRNEEAEEQSGSGVNHWLYESCAYSNNTTHPLYVWLGGWVGGWVSVTFWKKTTLEF